MRSFVIPTVLVAALYSHVDADVRIGAVGHVTSQNFTNGLRRDESSLGVGLSVDWMADSGGFLTYGVRVGWRTWRVPVALQFANGEMDDGSERVNVFSTRFFVEKRWTNVALGGGIGLDHSRNSDRASPHDSHTMVASNLQLAVDVAHTTSGAVAVIAGVEMFPLIDILQLVSNGEADVGYRGLAATLGAAFRY